MSVRVTLGLVVGGVFVVGGLVAIRPSEYESTGSPVDGLHGLAEMGGWMIGVPLLFIGGTILILTLVAYLDTRSTPDVNSVDDALQTPLAEPPAAPAKLPVATAVTRPRRSAEAVQSVPTADPPAVREFAKRKEPDGHGHSGS